MQARAAAHSPPQGRAEHGFFKQAIWAWTKYIQRHRDDYAAHRDRLAAYDAYLDQQAGRGRVQRLLRMATEAARSMLRSFPGDTFAAAKMAAVLYKGGRGDQCALVIVLSRVAYLQVLLPAIVLCMSVPVSQHPSQSVGRLT